MFSSKYKTLSFLHNFSWIQDSLWIKESLDLAHPFEGKAMFGLHKFHFHQAYPMFSCGCAAKFQRSLNKLFGESLGSPILLGWRGNQRMKVAISYMAHNTSFQVHFFQEVLCITNQFDYSGKRHCCVSCIVKAAWITAHKSMGEIVASFPLVATLLLIFSNIDVKRPCDAHELLCQR